MCISSTGISNSFMIVLVPRETFGDPMTFLVVMLGSYYWDLVCISQICCSTSFGLCDILHDKELPGQMC